MEVPTLFSAPPTHDAETLGDLLIRQRSAPASINEEKLSFGDENFPLPGIIPQPPIPTAASVKMPGMKRSRTTDSVSGIPGGEGGLNIPDDFFDLMHKSDDFEVEDGQDDFNFEDDNLLASSVRSKKRQKRSPKVQSSAPIIPDFVPAPVRMKTTRVGELYVSITGNENCKNAGKVRKNESVSIEFHNTYHVWEVFNAKKKLIGVVEEDVGRVLEQLSEDFKSVTTACRVKQGNTSLLSNTIVVKIVIDANPLEADGVDNFLGRELTFLGRSDLFRSNKRSIPRKRSASSVKSEKSVRVRSDEASPTDLSVLKKSNSMEIEGPMGVSPAEALSTVDIKPIETSAFASFGKSVEIKTDEVETDLDKLFQTTDHENLPEAEVCLRVRTKLYSYQKQGLFWMQDQEKEVELSGKETFGWTKRRNGKDGKFEWYNRTTGEKKDKVPHRWRGGILADEMGLGKTIQIISMITATARDNINMRNIAHPNVTLVICPLSVITNWEMQLKRHVRKDNPLKIYTYHGSDRRKKDKKSLKEYDVIITTYSIVSQEWKDPDAEKRKRTSTESKVSNAAHAKDEPNSQKHESGGKDDKGKGNANGKDTSKKNPKPKPKKSPLFALKFLRVVLDEAHTIRDRKTRQARACHALKAERRWCITGTPFQNKIEDVFSLLQFLRVEPLNHLQWWTKLIAAPLKSQDQKAREKGMKTLQKIMSRICLRRKKADKLNGKNILQLPPKVDFIQKVTLTENEQKVYDALAKSGKKKFRSIVRNGSVKEHFAFVLQMLLRMRQACCDINLVPIRYHNGFTSDEILRFEEKMLTLWEESISEECEICETRPVDPCMAGCGHKFCKSCINERTITSRQKREILTCSACDREIEKGETIFKDDIERWKRDREERESQELAAACRKSLYRSTKVKALLKGLQTINQKDPTWKAVVFSQFATMLDIVHSCLKREGYESVRIDGRMSNQARKKALEDFAQKPNVKIFLISLKAGGQGLNLTSANTVFLLDPWWNPAAEDQAVARIHRCGQKKPVNIIRFIASGTVEEKILDLQKT